MVVLKFLFQTRRQSGIIHWFIITLIAFQHNREGFGRDVYFAEFLEAFFAFGLLGQLFFLARDVAAIETAGHILAISADVFAGDKLAADSRL